ncbi:MAG: hypothetical protein K0R83_1590 [Caulobacter sp.]|nr:hypothetical protein [Caulobacter sp.]
MIRPPLLILAGAALLAAAVTLWPARESHTVAAGVLPASSGPRLAAAETAMEEPSSAARMTRFAAAGAPLATAETPEAAPPPRADETPVLVGVMGRDGALTGYFSANGLSVRARRGDEVDGWQVAALGRRDARLVKGGKVLKLSLFTARSGPLSPAMAAPERRFAAAPVPAAEESVIGPAAAAAPKGPPRVRWPLPPLPLGSTGWWSGPPGAKPPPGYTQIPKLSD